MDFVYASNNAFFRYLIVSINSLMRHNKNSNIHILSNDLSDENKEILIQKGKSNDCNVFFQEVNINFIQKLKLRYHFPHETYFRLVAHKYLSVSKVIFLDSDTVILGDLKHLFNLKLNEYYLAASTDPIIEYQFPGFEDKKGLLGILDRPYYNVGVILMNLSKIKKDRVFDKTLEYIQNNPEICEYLDQDGINAIMNKQIFEIGQRYNLNIPFLNHKIFKNTLNELEAMNSIVLHFASSIKPLDFRYNGIYKSFFIYNYFESIGKRKIHARIILILHKSLFLIYYTFVKTKYLTKTILISLRRQI